MVLRLHPRNNHAPVTAEISQNAHFKEIACKKTWFIKRQLPQKRQRKHQTSFRHSDKRNETELSKYIWDLKDQKKSFRVKWRVLKTCHPYNSESKKCNLCLQEKYFIIFRKDLSSLNKRNELASSCRHRNRFTLKSFRIT